MLAVDTDRMQRYIDFENMDNYGTVTAALDLYADDATVPDSIHGKTVWATSKDKLVRDVVNDLLDRRLAIDAEVWAAVRNLCKYGDAFAEILVNEKGVLGLNWLPSPTMRRLADDRGTLIGFVQDPTGQFAFPVQTPTDIAKLRDDVTKGGCVFFEPWEVVHWRLRGKAVKMQYGTSVIDGARWTWKRLVMMEDTALIFKLSRSPARFAFYIDTGDVPPREARQMVQDVQRRYKKSRIVDAQGQLDFRWNPMTALEDFFIPVRQGKEATRIDVLAGPDYQIVDDLEYFRQKMFTDLRIPAAYLSEAEFSTRASLTQQDVEFARLEMRIQRGFLEGLRQVVRIHLAALNIDPDSVKWDLRMNVPSSIFEMQQIEVMNARAALAQSMRDYMTVPWILANIFHFSDEDALFAAEAKRSENEMDALGNAQIQADILQRFPELGPEGAMALQAGAEGGAGVPMGAEGAAPMEGAPVPRGRLLTGLAPIAKTLATVQEGQAQIARRLQEQSKSMKRVERMVPDMMKLGRRTKRSKGSEE